MTIVRRQARLYDCTIRTQSLHDYMTPASFRALARSAVVLFALSVPSQFVSAFPAPTQSAAYVQNRRCPRPSGTQPLRKSRRTGSATLGSVSPAHSPSSRTVVAFPGKAWTDTMSGGCGGAMAG